MSIKLLLQKEYHHIVEGHCMKPQTGHMGKIGHVQFITSVRNALQMVNGDMNVEIDNYATAPKPTTLKIALETLMAIEIEPVLKAKPRMTFMASFLMFK